MRDWFWVLMYALRMTFFAFGIAVCWWIILSLFLGSAPA